MTTFHTKLIIQRRQVFKTPIQSVSEKNSKLLFMDAKNKEQGKGKTEKHIEIDIWISIME